MKPDIPIAITSMSLVFPGANDLSSFWNNIVNKVDTCADVPEDRWIVKPDQIISSDYTPDKAVSKRACLIRNFTFDPTGFELHPKLLIGLDPLYHLVLQAGRAAFSGCQMEKIDKHRIGVVLAAIALPTDSSSELAYKLFGKHKNLPLLTKTDRIAAKVTSLPASILSAGLGISGPSYTLDAACASSLYAVKLACDDLQSFRSDAMLAGGVSRPDCLYTQIGFSQLRALSPSGRCAPFDKTADGLVVGEGAGIIVLKRLEDAIRHGDVIYGIIRGIGLSNDTRGNLLAPDTKGQVRAMMKAYHQAHWIPQDVDLIECHGAGTPIGDQTELQSLRTVWGNSGWALQQCAIGSVKSMIGHLLTGAGAAGLIKTVLAIHHHILPPSLNFSSPSDNSPLIGSPFRVQTQPDHWKKNKHSRKAAVSAFGFGGINAHVLIEEWIEKDRQKFFVSRFQPKKASETSIVQTSGDSPVAIVGMEAFFGKSSSIASFLEIIFQGKSIIEKRPKNRWKTDERVVNSFLNDRCGFGTYIDSFSITASEFRIPPSEIPDILNQQLLMLQVAANALKDAQIDLRSEKLNMGAIIGMEFDYEATNYHLRWRSFGKTGKYSSNDGMPLTSVRTVGALGGIVASRVAKEFRFGGPSFGVSCDAASGIKALDIGIQMLRHHELNAVLIGAVDLAGDIRNIAVLDAFYTYSKKDHIHLFDSTSDGILPGEGSVAIVLKRLEDAIRDGNKIYAIIKGIGFSGGGGIIPELRSPDLIRVATSTSLTEACHNGCIQASQINFFEVSGTGNASFDQVGLEVITNFCSSRKDPINIGSVVSNIGHTGACSGFASIVKAALCLYHKTIPPILGAPSTPWNKELLHFPIVSTYWTKAQQNRIACVGCFTGDGQSAHVILEEFAHPNQTEQPKVNMIDQTVDIFPQNISPSMQHKKQINGHDNQFPIDMYSKLTDGLTQSMKSTAEAHQQFLDFSKELTTSYGQTFAWQMEIFKHQFVSNDFVPQPDVSEISTPSVLWEGENRGKKEVLPVNVCTPINREMCLEFAIGSVAKVLGPEFAVVDTYPVRVRLPDEPLMLVDRIISIEGTKGSLGSGRIITEHDVFEHAWYLDGGRAPVCISVEAGQADLFLCAYLGIDLVVKGKRVYRLLDATVKFHRGLPQPGDVIRYEIEILKFVRQGDTWMFFFQFDGFIGNSRLITMRNGCAGFFTEEEIRNSGGIILTEKDLQPQKGKLPIDWKYPVPIHTIESYDDSAIESLRKGDLFSCFGEAFKGVRIPESIRLPGGRMTLIHRVIKLDPTGGRYGIGLIQAEADIHPDDWFLTCHFMDDMVMPGTLMYECCAHTLRVFLQRIGWITDKLDACYEPVIGIESVLKCRGPVTPKTKKVIYEVEINELGYNPEPYAIANALMMADGRRIVKFDNMTLKLSGVTKHDIDEFWEKIQIQNSIQYPKQMTDHEPLFNRNQILEFAYGKPSVAFGDRYKPFDSDRFIARLPSPPYSFLDRIISVEPPPWVLQPDGWVEAEYDVPKNEWYFRSERTGSMPFCVILEIALQLCGWLAAYAGSALRSHNKLQFRNLGGKAVLYYPIYPDVGTLKIRSRMTQVSEAADMIIEHFDMQIYDSQRMVYDGNTYFGFFTPQALSQQIGLRGAEKESYHPSEEEVSRKISFKFTNDPPTTPDDLTTNIVPLLTMPSSALRMIDEIECFIPDGGPFGMGFVRGVKQVQPDEWFFRAHFYQDPVWPGSLGIEAFIQLIKYAAIHRWQHFIHTHRFEPITGISHQWMYRGQVIQTNRRVEVEAVITSVSDDPIPMMLADGFLKVDGRYIYKMTQFGVALISNQ